MLPCPVIHGAAAPAISGRGCTTARRSKNCSRSRTRRIGSGERRARRRPVEEEPNEKGGREEREGDEVCRDPGVVEEGAEREVRRDEGEGAGCERGPAAWEGKRKRGSSSVAGAAGAENRRLVAQDVQ